MMLLQLLLALMETQLLSQALRAACLCAAAGAALGDNAAAAGTDARAQLSVSSDVSGVLSCCGCRSMRRQGDDAAAAAAADGH